MTLQRQAWRSRLFRFAAGVSDRLQRLPNRFAPAPFRLLQIGSAFWQSRALYVAAKLDVATVLGDSRQTVEELAARLSVDRDALFRLLRMLGAMGIFDTDQRGRVANNVLSQPLRADSPACIRNMVLMHNSPEMSRPWYETLEHGLRGGGPPFAICHGQELYDYMNAHPTFDTLFSTAMDEVEALSGDSFATAFDWRRFKRVIDVGGSRGSRSAAILRRHPHMRATIVDRRQVIEQAKGWWSDSGDSFCGDRMEFVEGALLAGPLPRASGPHDVYLLSAILHGFDDAVCSDILKQVARAAGTSGAAIVLLEMVMPDRNVGVAQASFDVQMFMGTRGRERTRAEWRKVYDLTGLVLREEIALASFGQMLVLRT